MRIVTGDTFVSVMLVHGVELLVSGKIFPFLFKWFYASETRQIDVGSAEYISTFFIITKVTLEQKSLNIRYYFSHL